MKTLLSLSGERAQSYLSYERMKMYVYGTTPWISNENTNVEMFMRFGFGDNYYELIQPVYDGWDEGKNRNSIDLDLEWLSRLKLQDSSSVKKYSETIFSLILLILKNTVSPMIWVWKQEKLFVSKDSQH
ncbi:MAG: hypothetical protein Ct9H300mP29_0400 [Candidatus Neomarinimicrobiota bacterium]|nr:MAG: hypothetical protein Ct9H300mP29_0400 [Candidatus Neomarinimicrobiota bacterium]